MTADPSAPAHPAVPPDPSAPAPPSVPPNSSAPAQPSVSPDLTARAQPAVPPAAAPGPRSAAASIPVADPGLSRELQPPFPVDVPLTLSVHRHGGGDPTFATDRSGAVWRTSLTPDGPGTLRISSRSSSAVVTARAWGPGAGWLLDHLPDWLGFHDDRAGFTVHHPVLSELVLRFEGLRVGRTGRVFEALVPAVLEQKVVGHEAFRAWRFLLRKHGEAAPGPAPAAMRVVPAPQSWARIPSWDWHRAGVEGVRARTIINAAAVAARLEEALDLAPAEADRRLRSLPGIGVWTSAEIRQRAMGDPDAVSVGDYHLPSVVGWTLARRKTDDAGMLELLAPYAGHRYRVTRLVELGGSAPPRRGPRMPIRDYRSF